MDYVSAVDGYLAKHPDKSKTDAFKALEINQASYYNQRHKAKGKKKLKAKPHRPTKGKVTIEASIRDASDNVIAFVGSARAVRSAVEGWLI